MTRRYPLIVLLALAIGMLAMPARARADDNGTINIMTPEKGTVQPGKARPARKYKTRGGSSNPVYPTPLPGSQPLTPVPRLEAVTPRSPRVLPPIVVPQTGQALQNLPTMPGSGPGGAETFQDRAARCTHQAGVYGDAAGNRNAYVGSCINQ